MVEACLRLCFWPKTHAQASICELERCHGVKSMIYFSRILCVSAHNFKIVFLTIRTTFWHELMIHHVIAIEEDSKQNLQIWPNLTCFFRSWLFRTLPLGWFGFNVMPYLHDKVMNFLGKLDYRLTPSTSPEQCPCSKIGTIFEAARFIPKTYVKTVCF